MSHLITNGVGSIRVVYVEVMPNGSIEVRFSGQDGSLSQRISAKDALELSELLRLAAGSVS
jgi:hypothetical protein